MTKPFWFSQLLASGKGPDWVFNAAFAPGSSQILAEAVRRHAPPGFGYYRATQRACPLHMRSCDYDIYIDTPHYLAIVDQLEGRQERNIYIYHTIQVCQHEYQIVHGYGGDADQHGEAETRMVRALAHTPGLAMTGWSILYGGVTYPYDTLISGATSAALFAYLDARE